MDMGLPPDERATLQALVDAAAPEPVPAHQAIALLQRVSDLDSESLGRLAYHALTGVDPGDSEPAAPGAVLPGFPPFAAEVLMRAICGPDHRRPTPQAIVIVLDTVPAGSWPTAGRSAVELNGSAASTPIEAVAEVAPETVETPVVEELPEPEPEPEVEPVSEPVDRDAEFRNLLIPSRAVPRFDPLSDPWEPEPALQSELAYDENVPHVADELVPDEPVFEEPVAEEPVLAEPVVEEPAAEAEPEPVVEDEAEPATELESIFDAEPEPADEPDAGMFSEFRNLVPSTFEVPHIGASLGNELEVLTEDPRRRSSSGRRRSSSSGKKATASGPKDRGPMMLLIAAIVVLILLAVVYFAAKQMREDPADLAPQGASRVTSQPVGTRA